MSAGLSMERGMTVAQYMSMQAVRFRSKNDYERFQMLFKEAIKAASLIPGFISITWWTHPEDPELFLETSIWDNKDAPNGWHKDGFHKKLKEWGVQGPIIEDQVTNWSLEDAKILRVCPVCGSGIAREFDLRQEIENKRIGCECGFAFPYLDTTNRFTVYTG
jgi:heme-degrading monooxygenase HmoA